MKALAAILTCICLALGVGLYLLYSNAQKEKIQHTAIAQDLSNREHQVRDKLDEQLQVNLSLETNRAELKAALEEASNRLAITSAKLAQTTAEKKAEAEAAALAMAKRDARIRQLEGQNDDLSKKMGDLNTAMDGLEKQINDTKRKLAASEGDRVVLMKELKRLQTEKAELERQFNDLVAVRSQVRKLREELGVARRLEWIRDGIYGALAEAGQDKLLRGSDLVTQTNSGASLNVEVRQDGGVKIESTPATNAPPAR